jgi:hypothetical protein
VAIVTAGGRRKISVAAFLLLAGLGLATLMVSKRWKDRGHAPEVYALASVIRANLHGCMFGFDADPILYMLTHSCLPTSRVFPNHLNEAIEAKAVGVDPTEEVRRIMYVAKPDIVVGSDRPDPDFNPATLAIMRRALAVSYRPIFEIKAGSRYRIVYKRIRLSAPLT